MFSAERSATRQTDQLAKPAQSSRLERIYHGSVRALSILFVALGVTILVATLVVGGGPLSRGMLIGVGFVAIGCGRLWAASRLGR
jgi:hypothetical protein